MKQLSVLVLPLLVAGIAQAQTVYVPDDFSTIQEAVQAASNGEEIVVRPGSYFENVFIVGKDIVVRSEHGPNVTEINAGQAGACVVFEDNPGSSRLAGFTLTNGSGKPDFLNRGGAIHSKYSAPIIEDCVVVGNMVNGDGGGIYTIHSSPVIRNNVIRDNEASWYNGGGIGCWASSPIIEGNIIELNRTPGNSGAGIMLVQCELATIKGNVIRDNVSGGEGCGIKLEGCNKVVVEGNQILRNDANGAGAGIESTSTAVFRDNVIADNDAHGHGGGLHLSGGSAELFGNTISGNYAWGSGGGIHAYNTAISNVVGNTFLDNFAEAEGGGMRLSGLTGTYLVSSNLFAGNVAVGFGNGGKGGGFRVDGGSPQVISNRVVDNRVLDRGGGFFLGDTTGAVVAGNEVAGNWAAYHGGGMEALATDGYYANNLFYANIGGESAGGMRVRGGVVVNTIFAANTAIEGPQMDFDNNVGPEVRHCIVPGGWPGTANLDQEAAFVDPIGMDGIPGTLDDDLRSGSCGAGIQAGDPTGLPSDTADLDGDGDLAEPLPLDLLGLPRVVGALDIGCYELQPGGPGCPSSVDCDGNGIRDEVDIAQCDGSAWCLDCNGNGRPDPCDLVPPVLELDGGRGYWRFEDGSGLVVDSGLYGLDGVPTALSYTTDVPIATIPQNGEPNPLALSLDGFGYFVVDDPNHLLAFGSDEPSDFTVESWVRLDVLASGPNETSERQYLAQKKRLNGKGGWMDFSIMVQGANVQGAMDYNYGKQGGFTGRELVVQFGTAGNTWSVTSNLEIDDNEWHHISVAKDNSALTVRFGLDGVFETHTYPPMYQHANDGPLLVGAHTNQAGQFNQYLRGDIDEFRISPGVRSVHELLSSFPVGSSGDCNGNGIPDDCDIAAGLLADANGDLFPDGCGTGGQGTPYCFGDSGCPCGNDDPMGDAGCATSSGSGVQLTASGSTSVGADDLVLTATGVPLQQTGLMFLGDQQIFAPFGDGQRCVGGFTGRFPIRSAGATGVIVEGPGLAAYTLTSLPSQAWIDPGDTVHFQCWVRDPGGPCGSSFTLSNALSVSFTP